MADYSVPWRNEEFKLDISLSSQANANTFQSSPTIAAGDFKVKSSAVGGGALTNLTNLPTVEPAGSKVVRIILSATEMNSELVTVLGSDAAGAEWRDIRITLQTRPRAGLERLFAGALLGAIDNVTFAPTTTVFEVSGLADAADNTYANQSITFATGALAGKTYFITASEGTTTNVNDKVKLTIQAAHVAPANGDQFIVGPGTRGS